MFKSVSDKGLSHNMWSVLASGRETLSVIMESW